jgi:hypothetical protein
VVLEIRKRPLYTPAHESEVKQRVIGVARALW